MDARFDILYTVLEDLQDAGVLKHVVLVGSWCQEFYRHHYEDSFQIPATRTMDADILIPRRIKVEKPVDLFDVFQKRGFVPRIHHGSGFAKFIHRELTFEFLTDAGAKPDEKQLRFKDLNIVAQELHFMNIPLAHYMTVQYKDITLNIAEPEAFALHKLIVSQRRGKPDKKEKDTNTARGMFQFFKGKKHYSLGRSLSFTFLYPAFLRSSGCGSMPMTVISALPGPYAQNSRPAAGVLFSR